jgi:predicted house-cleaning NTP pyrophosphatase (Maf/HAM1 superfamily)
LAGAAQDAEQLQAEITQLQQKAQEAAEARKQLAELQGNMERLYSYR